MKKTTILAEQAKKRMLSGVKVDPHPTLDEGSEKGQVLDKIAESSGISRGTLHKIKAIKEKCTPEIIDDLRAGKTTIGAEYRKMKEGEKPLENKDLDWITPKKIHHQIRLFWTMRFALNAISTEEENLQIKAKKFYTLEESLEKDWCDFVFLHMPTGHGMASKFCEKLNKELSEGRIKNAFVLAPLSFPGSFSGLKLARKFESTCIFEGSCLVDINGNKPKEGQFLGYTGCEYGFHKSFSHLGLTQKKLTQLG